ncbi:MAG TPA: hypothetical protein PKD61_21980, partial [Polyangiaceae bacterium]|nr:hypothetical protein [Polyangiaceae bacterium]
RRQWAGDGSIRRNDAEAGCDSGSRLTAASDASDAGSVAGDEGAGRAGLVCMHVCEPLFHALLPSRAAKHWGSSSWLASRASKNAAGAAPRRN